jgi:hypothetical protein
MVLTMVCASREGIKNKKRLNQEESEEGRQYFVMEQRLGYGVHLCVATDIT